MEQRTSANLARLRLEVAHQPVTALDPGQQHEVLAELLLILVEAPHLDRTAGPPARR
jgi:hypothetical protein